MIRNHCFAEWLGSHVCNIFFTLDSPYSQPLESDFILHPKIGHINVLQFPNSFLWNMCSVAFAAMANNGFTWLPRSLNVTIPFDSDTLNAAAYNSGSPLLLTSIFCYQLYTFLRHDHQTLSRLRLVSFDFPCNLPSPSL